MKTLLIIGSIYKLNNNRMEQKDKELLLKDLCARLPYKVKAQIPDEYGGYTSAIESIDIDGFVVDFEGTQIEIEYIKPYLFPLSSMTERQCYKLASIRSEFQDCWKYVKTPIPLSICNFEQIDWFHKNHLDYRGLIPKGLAIDATGLNIY